MGRNVAGESFLRGYLQYSQAPELCVLTEKAELAKHFVETASRFGRHEPVTVLDRSTLAAVAQFGILYLPGPGISEHAQFRAAFGHESWSLCGITHTTSSAAAMDVLSNLIVAPVQPWDAVICTSMAVKDNLERLLQAQIDYLQERLGIQKLVLPKLPIIPLGIHSDDFVFTEKQRADARDLLDVDAHALVVLFVGRLSFHAKAHPLAMYQALEVAAKQTGKKITLVECGWHANGFIQNAFVTAANLVSPNVHVIMLDGRSVENRHIAWASADIFCSLSDNIQETFGIAPIEAMAAGLPVVVSDWDGYKDTVRDGIDGFRIPTLMPAPRLGSDLALRHALEIDTYDMYCGNTCSLVAVDVQAATQAFIRLFQSQELRKQMGDAGRQRAREVYDWATIIPQYEVLWDGLSEIRKSQSKNMKPLAHPWPARMDPFHAFASYPTHTLTPQTMLGLVDADASTALQRTLAYKKLAMVNFAEAILPTETEIEILLNAASATKKPASVLIQEIPAERQPYVLRSLVWLVKLGVLRLFPD